jgi:hypothetical protein
VARGFDASQRWWEPRPSWGWCALQRECGAWHCLDPVAAQQVPFILYWQSCKQLGQLCTVYTVLAILQAARPALRSLYSIILLPMIGNSASSQASSAPSVHVLQLLDMLQLRLDRIATCYVCLQHCRSHLYECCGRVATKTPLIFDCL